MTNELQILEEIRTPANITAEDIKKYICPMATDKEVFMFLNICKMYNLNPFKRGEIYLIKYSPSQAASTLVGYETYLKRAEESKNWDGMEATTEGKTEDNTLKAIVKIYRKDWNHPFTHEVYYSEYVQRKQDGTVNKFWKEKPQTMIKKVCLSQAFRLCFPSEFSGMPYTKEEFNDVEYTDTVAINQKPALEFPKSKDEATLDIVKESITNDITEASLNVKSGPIKQTDQLPIIAQSEWDKLVKMALSNGWSEIDIGENVRSLGYKASKKFTPLNAWDYETVEAFFSCKKVEYEKVETQKNKAERTRSGMQ